nr:hypothetical protein [Megavirus caiporensis]
MESGYSKLFGCNVHSSIRVGPMALSIINTQYFQRMKKIKQLGLTNWVFPTATHTRFEHSLGVYHLAGKMLEKIKTQYPDMLYNIPILSDDPLLLTDKIIECIKIAGLCHDIGHGPFSHIFDDILLSNVTHKNHHHEQRSCLITGILCERELRSELSDKEILFIKSIIDPGPNDKGALYQIICNNLNGIDVDKFDYLARDSINLKIGIEFNANRLIDDFIIDGGNIVYPKHCSADIYKMFHSRYMMHKTVYSHKTVKLLEMMLKDIFIKIDPIFKISDTINNMNDFCKLTDDSIFNLIETTINPPSFIDIKLSINDILRVHDAYKIYQNMINRILYKQIIDISEEDNPNDKFNSFINHIVNKHPNIKTDDFYIFVTKCGFTNNLNKSPFDDIFFYDKKENSSKFTLRRSHYSGLMNNKSQEVHYHLYCKKKDIYKIAINELKNFIF